MHIIRSFLLAVFATALTAGEDVEVKGVVETTPCGGFGTPVELRISDCEFFCEFEPGKTYNAELVFLPSQASSSVTLRVEVCCCGECIDFINVELGAVVVGQFNTARYSITPTPTYAGKMVEFRAYIYHTVSYHMEICLGAQAFVIG